MSNDQIILDQILEQSRAEIAPSLDQPTYFEVFSAEQVLKDYDLSYDEIESGIISGGGDGGIDGFYVFVNGELIHDDSDVSDLRKNVQIEVILIQAKTTAGFSESAMDRFASATSDLFDLSKPLESLKAVYRAELLQAASRLRRVYQDLASKFPRLRILYFYASKGDQVHPNVSRKVSRIETAVTQHFSDAQSTFQFLKARDLLDLARKAPTTTYHLKLAETPLSSTGDVAFICLVALKDFFAFITDKNGNLLRHIFEANVRDYQGKTQVNEQIQETLRAQGAEDFWWLNNGITIISTKATQSGKSLTVENPEIVNGLQSSTEIHSYFRASNTEAELRNVLVRVIVPNAAESRDRIIKATNSQTALPQASLRATDRIHRDIEQFLKPFGFYYDRRKNFYKNEGKPLSRIMGIPQMAQAIMAVVLKRPDSARARPSSLIKRDDEYQKLFNLQYPIEVYRASAVILKDAEAFLSEAALELPGSDRTNIKFYIAMAASQVALRHSTPNVTQIATLAATPPSRACYELSYEIVKSEYDSLGATDQVAKGPDLVRRINERLVMKFSPVPLASNENGFSASAARPGL
jgi:hypothetical protein